LDAALNSSTSSQATAQSSTHSSAAFSAASNRSLASVALTTTPALPARFVAVCLAFAFAWDDVEELSAASKDKGQDSMKEVEISAADKAFIESTKKTISAARAAGQVDEKTLKEIEAAAAGMKEVTKKVNTARMQKMEKALEAAIAAAKQCTDDCPAAWEEVEEISAAKSREAGRD
jgi:hypothetical protein